LKQAWLNNGQALKEEGRVEEAEQALTQVKHAGMLSIKSCVRCMMLHLFINCW
jgi:hypothetical protein